MTQLEDARVPGRFLAPGRKAPPLKTSCQGSGRCCVDLLRRRHTAPPGTHLKHAEIPGLSKLTGPTPPVLMSHVEKQDTLRQMLVTYDFKVSEKKLKDPGQMVNVGGHFTHVHDQV